MKLMFIKIDRIEENKRNKVIHIPTGGLQFTMKEKLIQSAEPFQIECSHEGVFRNLIRFIAFAVYTDQSLNVVELMKESLFSIVAHQEVYEQLMEAMQQCKVAPFHRKLDVKELFIAEYEEAYKQLLEVQ